MSRQVAVVGSGQEHEGRAEEIGRLLAARGVTLICGGRGEVMAAAARGAKAGNHLQILSTATSTGPEEVTEARGAPLWYQLYWLRQRPFTEMLVRRAEEAGYRAIVITVDAPVSRSRERDVRHKWDLAVESDLAPTLEKDRMLRNFFGQEHLGLPLPEQADFNSNFDDTLTWRDL